MLFQKFDAFLHDGFWRAGSGSDGDDSGAGEPVQLKLASVINKIAGNNPDPCS